MLECIIDGDGSIVDSGLEFTTAEACIELLSALSTALDRLLSVDILFPTCAMNSSVTLAHTSEVLTITASLHLSKVRYLLSS